MNYFRDEYPQKVLNNAVAFAKALNHCGLDVAGDPETSFTQTHQVILKVGYSKGPEIADRLEKNNIIVNYQAAPEEEGFTASGSLRMGVQEMTRFGMDAEHFEELAPLMADVILREKNVRDTVTDFRKRFLDMRYCFSEEQIEGKLNELYGLL
jgi:aminomethyltransferase